MHGNLLGPFVIDIDRGSTLGRIGPGCLADRLGPFNTTLLMTAFTVLVALVIWAPFEDESADALYVASAFLGFGQLRGHGRHVSGSSRRRPRRGQVLRQLLHDDSLDPLVSNPVCRAIPQEVRTQSADSISLLGTLVCVLDLSGSEPGPSSVPLGWWLAKVRAT